MKTLTFRCVFFTQLKTLLIGH